jgi:quinol monooxygenase YgiN
LAALYDLMQIRNPERFYRLFEKYSDQPHGERRKRSKVAPWRYR